jgi:hypothetical protein
LAAVLQDIRYAFRQLRNHPGFALTAILSLALGIGATVFVGPGYFSTLRIPLVQGHMWDHTEVAHGALLVLVNQSFVKRYYPNGDVLGALPESPDNEK